MLLKKRFYFLLTAEVIMSWAMNAELRRLLYKYLPQRLVKHYIVPNFVPGKRIAGDPQKFFDSWYSLSEEFSDGITISPTYKPMFVSYYFNLIENSLTFILFDFPALKSAAALDVGSGAGHWIKYLKEICEVDTVTGMDISQVCIDKLRGLYEGKDGVEIRRADISEAGLNLGRKYNVIVSIQTIFHIAEDDKWEQALLNMSNHLDDDGVIIINEHFGLFTLNTQFNRVDTFTRWEEGRVGDEKSESVLVLQRLRSLRAWKRAARKAGLSVQRVIRNRNPRGIFTPETNLIVLRKSGR